MKNECKSGFPITEYHTYQAAQEEGAGVGKLPTVRSASPPSHVPAPHEAIAHRLLRKHSTESRARVMPYCD